MNIFWFCVRVCTRVYVRIRACTCVYIRVRAVCMRVRAVCMRVRAVCRRVRVCVCVYMCVIRSKRRMHSFRPR